MTDGYISYAQALFDATIPILEGSVRQWALNEGKTMLMQCAQQRVNVDGIYTDPNRFASWININHQCNDKKEEDAHE
jgi:hypothetical protein